ncbi:acid protease [Laetiporus sulphureus 93-53]|uniref:Acid protease n=1 Tax=Laetiporus sulphureus 93-53 TaxID=1314785 RepID=A0A165C554_9APHY|nr:acid protease [Laetiporus sulphureus 93-53]KZT02222.1 acid protease [Laetiporus sulphureus 93-53]
MALRSFFLMTLVFALAVVATPIRIRNNRITLPMVKRANSTSMTSIVLRDQARALNFKGRTSKNQRRTNGTTGDIAATNQAEDYVVSVGIGSPPTYYTLLVDTGSSNTWVGAAKAYVQTTTSVNTGDSVTVTYGSGAFTGTEFEDTVTLGDLTIAGQSIGVASEAEGFSGVDGIIGLGPQDLTAGTVSSGNADTATGGGHSRHNNKDASRKNGRSSFTTSETSDEVPTVTDNLFSQGTIAENVVGIFFAPTTSDNDTNGELTFGGVDDSKTTSDVTYTSITTTSPASEYWGIDQSITYGSSGTSILASTAGIVDTGTTLILLSTDGYSAYMEATGATEDETTGLLTISSTDYDNLQSLFFNIGGTSFELTANAQTWPRSLNTAIGGSADDIYLVISSTGTPSGEGLDFINGYTFLERFYSVFDTTNSRVGFATTADTNSTSN